MRKERFDQAFARFLQRDPEPITSKTFFEVLAEIERERGLRTIEVQAKVVNGQLQFQSRKRTRGGQSADCRTSPVRRFRPRSLPFGVPGCLTVFVFGQLVQAASLVVAPVALVEFPGSVPDPQPAKGFD